MFAHRLLVWIQVLQGHTRHHQSIFLVNIRPKADQWLTARIHIRMENLSIMYSLDILFEWLLTKENSDDKEKTDDAGICGCQYGFVFPNIAVQHVCEKLAQNNTGE